ncbi:DTX3L [Branchiostoma lanceolatum]|uniref:E3 ubiquitin-protein ligase n=1 Tax=Branchiostoma lanceolatum TaxID=7740 RepID=A0A8K0EGF5_BRALA|nr:DTX3L [Branchiostoma lanceolatum]
MGVSVSKPQQDKENNMEGSPKTVSPGDRRHKHKHGREQKSTTSSRYSKGKSNIDLQGSRVTVEEPLGAQGVTATRTHRTKEGGNLYPFHQMHEAKIASQEGNQSSKDKPGHDLLKYELYSNGHMTMSSHPTKTAMLQGMQGYVSDEEDVRDDHGQLADNNNDFEKVSKIETNAWGTSEPAEEMAIELDAVKLEFIKKVHGIELTDIRHRNDVVIEQTESQPCKVTFRTYKPGKGNAERACEQFMELYRRVSAALSRNNTVNVLQVLPDCTIRTLNNALTLAKADNRVLVKNCLSDDFMVIFYGSETDVANAIDNFIKNARQKDDHEASTFLQPRITHMQIMDTQDYDLRIPKAKHLEGTIGDIKISVYEGDLTQVTVDVVVNAANKRLDHAGGVALAISRAGGRKIQKESYEYVDKHGTIPIGQVMHTGAGKMPCQYVIHTVGPKWNNHGDEETVKAQLYEALVNVLYYAANRLKATSIAIPAISAGIYGVPVDVCAGQLMLATLKFVQSPPENNTLRDIRFVNIDDQINRTFVRIFSDSLPSNPTEPSLSNHIGEEKCPICMDNAVRPRKLYCCSNVFCNDCIDQAFQVKPVCPTCGHHHGALKGTQPLGTMEVSKSRQTLPGYHNCGNIQIHYHIPDGIQEECHPNPGRPYEGTTRVAYLPDNTQGREVLRLLTNAFDNRLVFTIGASVTTGQTDVVIWNDIHHKTSPDGGPTKYGYPDPGYLRRVTDELAAKGIR